MISKQIYNILHTKEKVSIFFLLILSFLNIIVETLTIGSVIPLITALINFDQIENNHFVILFTEYFFKEVSKKNFLVLIAYSIIALITIKVIAEIYIVNFKTKIQNNLVVYFQKNLLKKFLNENWRYHLKNDSSKLIRQLTHEIGHIVGKIIIPIIEIIVDIGLTISFFILLTLYDYKISIIVFLLIVSTLAILNYFTKSQVKKISNKRYFISLISFKIISEIFIILKDIIISSTADPKINKYITLVKKYYTYERLINIYNILPKMLFEFLTILIICLGIIFYSKSFNDYSLLLTSLSLYMAAAVKMIPSSSRIARNLQYIQVGKPIFKSQEQNLIDIKKGFFEDKKKDLVSINQNIELKNINFSFKKDETLLENINLKLNKNELIAITGESGDGKTTLANIIMGIIKPNYGEIRIDGNKIDFFSEKIKLNIGYVDQTSKLIDDTLKMNITFSENLSTEQNHQYEILLKKCGLDKLEKKINARENKKIGEDSKLISGGEKQRISIARTVFRNPQIIIFDEPTSSLDKGNEEKIMDLIEKFKEDKIILVITHNKKYLSKFNKVYDLKNKTLFQLENI
jgi:ABC-type bacteriocin/lantibiotic exporter with double-glycine peptidase domain